MLRRGFNGLRQFIRWHREEDAPPEAEPVSEWSILLTILAILALIGTTMVLLTFLGLKF